MLLRYPYAELVYNIVERALLDSMGKQIDCDCVADRDDTIREAREWVQERRGGFDLYCKALNIDAEDKRKRIMED